MSIRIEATYPATDGSAPETVSIEWDTDDPDLLPSPTGLVALVDALAKVPRRYEVESNHAD